MTIYFNEKLFPLNALPSNVDTNEFWVKSFTGLSFKFVRTSSACPLQYDVFDEKGNRIGYVWYRARFFYVSLYGELVLEIVDEYLDTWSDWRFVDWATTVIAAGYSKIGMERERVRER